MICSGRRRAARPQQRPAAAVRARVMADCSGRNKWATDSLWTTKKLRRATVQFQTGLPPGRNSTGNSNTVVCMKTASGREERR